MTYEEFIEMLRVQGKPGTIKESDLADGAITAKKIKVGALTAETIAAGTITADKLSFNPYIIGTNDLDDVVDGTSYAKILSSAAQGGLVLLSQAVGNIDNIGDGTTYKKVLATDISAGHILLSSVIGTLDNVADGTSYGKVAITDIQAGHILLATAVGSLDNIADGSNYGKVALTSISAGKIIVAGLDSGVTARMFLDGTTKTNIEAWRHASDVTLIDGGDIYTKSITAVKLDIATITDNLILNPSFEQAGGWAVVEENGTATYSTADKTEGTYSLLLSAPAVGYGCRAIPLVPGDKYTVRVKLKGATATTIGLYIRMNEKTTYPAGDYVTADLRDSRTDFVTDGAAPSTWTTYEYTYTVPANIYWGSFSIYNWTGGPAGGIYIDEAEARKQLGAVHIEDGVISLTKLTFTPFVIGTDDLDDIAEGTNYGKVLKADISAGHILLSACSGNLDNIADGSNYGKVALTSISAGKIIVAGLDNDVTARMFADATTKTNIEAWRHASDVTLIDGGHIYTGTVVVGALGSDVIARVFSDGTTKTNIEAWRHASDVTLIDGGDIYTGTVTANKISVTSLSSIHANMGTITAGKIDVGNIEINADTERILMGAATAPKTGIGVFIGKDVADYEFRCGNPAGHMMHWDGATLCLYKDGTYFVNAQELEEGAARARMYIQGSPYAGGFQGKLMNDETGYYWAGTTYKISLTFLSGTKYMLTIDTAVPGGGAGSGDSCFIAKTRILMADGNTKKIADIQVGDYVLTRKSETSPKLVRARVLKFYEHPETDIFTVINDVLVVTPNHRMFINGKWQRVETLKLGDTLLDDKNRKIAVKSIKERREKAEKVYNLEIEKYRTYFANGFYAHNAKDPG